MNSMPKWSAAPKSAHKEGKQKMRKRRREGERTTIKKLTVVNIRSGRRISILHKNEHSSTPENEIK